MNVELLLRWTEKSCFSLKGEWFKGFIDVPKRSGVFLQQAASTKGQRLRRQKMAEAWCPGNIREGKGPKGKLGENVIRGKFGSPNARNGH